MEDQAGDHRHPQPSLNHLLDGLRVIDHHAEGNGQVLSLEFPFDNRHGPRTRPMADELLRPQLSQSNALYRALAPGMVAPHDETQLVPHEVLGHNLGGLGGALNADEVVQVA